MNRAIKITYRIIDGKDILDWGHNLTWELWNILCFTFTGYDYRKYPGKFNVDKTLRKLPQAINLADRCYSTTLDQFDIAMKSWWSNLKSNPKARPPKMSHSPRNLKFQIGRNAKPIGNFQYRLSVLGGNISDRYATIQVYLKPGIKMSQIKWLELMPDGTGSANIKIEQKEKPGDKIAAIDLGIVNIAVMAFDNGDSILISGRGLKSAKQWLNKREVACKPSNWSRGKAVFKQSQNKIRFKKKQGNIQTLACHNLTRFIVAQCLERKIGTLIIGDLKGIRDGQSWGSKNQDLHSWPYYKITEQLKYKCEEFGIELIQINERGTSSHCHICGQKGVRNPRGLLKCNHCDITINSDVNGAFGILNKVSPAPIMAGVGVVANFPGEPSPDCAVEIHGQRPSNQRTGEASQIDPTFVTSFDLRNWSMKQIVAT